MDCARIRESLSAQLDGEDPQLPSAVVDDHVAGCVACTAWVAAAADLRDAVRLSALPAVPDQTLTILERAGATAADDVARPWRAALAAVGVLQLVWALPALVFGQLGADSAHTAHELGSWDVALAVGFLFAAWRPARAWGLVPLVAALVACLMATSALDVLQGRAAAAGEAGHLLELLGLVFVWMVARVTRRPLQAMAVRTA